MLENESSLIHVIFSGAHGNDKFTSTLGAFECPENIIDWEGPATESQTFDVSETGRT